MISLININQLAYKFLMTWFILDHIVWSINESLYQLIGNKI